MNRLPLAVALLALALPVAAQVTRCVDPATKKTTYTDGPCKAQETSKQIARKLTPDEEEQQERDAAIGRLRFQRELLQAELRQIDERAAARRAAGGSVAAIGSGGDCARARRNVEVQDSSIARRGVPHAALDAQDAACGGYTPRASREIAEIERERQERKQGVIRR